MTALRIPSSTYRVQLNHRLRFDDARALVGYLEALGVSDLYTSPILRARPGSEHGYDVVDPTRVNAELGTLDDFDALAGALLARGMGLVVDIVPNHMAAHEDNRWWWDVLENGRASAYAEFFDIDWEDHTRGLGADRVVLPVLGAPLAEALEGGEIRLGYEPERGVVVRCGDLRFPLDPGTYDRALAPLARGLAADHRLVGPTRTSETLLTILERVKTLPGHDVRDAHQHAVRRVAVATIKQSMRALAISDPSVRERIGAALEEVSRPRGEGGDPVALAAILDRQAYRLEYWREGLERVNYRRFFDVSDLVGLREEDVRVFEETHGLILELVRAGRITGLRIDHIDGLADPAEYLERLETAVAGPLPGPSLPRSPRPGARFYLITEKILAADEAIPEEWPVHGTTGYDAMNALNGAFVDPAGATAVARRAHEWLGLPPRFTDTAFACKREAIESLFPSEARRLTRRAAAIAADDPSGRAPGEGDIRAAISAVTSALGVYRTYIRGRHVGAEDRARVESALLEAKERGAAPEGAIDWLGGVILGVPRDPSAPHDPRADDFIVRWQQFTGPVMAKGVEDTALYRHITIASLNEVGADPDAPLAAGVDPVGSMHGFFARRAAAHPDAMTATSTHDTKHGEDARARLNVLSEMPGEWTGAVDRWQRANARHTSVVDGATAPAARDELLLYQTLLAAWPLDGRITPEFIERVKAAMRKSAREAKVETSWLDQNGAYEAALDRFIDGALTDAVFLADLSRLERRIAPAGAINALAQLVLKIAAPGVPDVYQGSELWDLSLVDPDNRRPVDFGLRHRLLARLESPTAPPPSDLAAHWRDGRIKLLITARGLRFRRKHPDLFREGDYLPLEATGPHAGRLIGLARRLNGRWVVAVVPRLVLPFARSDSLDLSGAPWDGTAIALPPDAPTDWRDVITGASVSGPLEAAMLFAGVPVALLSSAV